MLSDSLDPDQDLQSRSKLFTWFDLCCIIRGGEISSRGGDYVLVVKFSGGDYVLVVKFRGGDYVLVVKFMGGILSTYTKMSRGGFVRGGLCPYPIKLWDILGCFHYILNAPRNSLLPLQHTAATWMSVKVPYGSGNMISLFIRTVLIEKYDQPVHLY